MEAKVALVREEVPEEVALGSEGKEDKDTLDKEGTGKEETDKAAAVKADQG